MTHSTWREPGDFLYQHPGVMVQEMFQIRHDHDCGCEQGDDGWVFDTYSFQWSAVPEENLCEWCGEEHGAVCPMREWPANEVPFATDDQKEMERSWQD